MEEQIFSTNPQEDYFKQILIENMYSFRDLELSDISMTKLTGLTNETYKAKCINKSKKQEPSIVLFRIFASAEGLIDKEKEHSIFIQLGEKGIGPKCYASQIGKWRIEEFIQEGVHPDHETLRQQQFRNLMAIYLAIFHRQKIQVKKEVPLTDKMLKNQSLFKLFTQKANKKEIFTEQELQSIEKIKEVIEPQTLDFLETIKPKNYLSVCHNDTNNLNIFYKKGKVNSQLVFIDYEYSSYNYAAYDIANFMNENSMNYNVEEDPFFKFEEENVFSQQQIETFAKYYLLILNYGKYFNEFEKVITDMNENDNEDDRAEQFFQQVLDSLTQEQQNQFEKDLFNLVFEINACRIISNWYWVIWGVLTSKPEVKMDFSHIEYSEFRLKIFHSLIQELKEQYPEKFYLPSDVPVQAQ